MNEPEFKVVLLDMSKFLFGYGFESPGFETLYGYKIFLLQKSRPALGPTYPTYSLSTTVPSSPGQSSRSVKLTSRLYLVPKLRMSGTVTIVSLCALMAWTGTSLPLVHFLCLTVPTITVCRLISQTRVYAALCSLSRSLCKCNHEQGKLPPPLLLLLLFYYYYYYYSTTTTTTTTNTDDDDDVAEIMLDCIHYLYQQSPLPPIK
jgi:hypothetical protein